MPDDNAQKKPEDTPPVEKPPEPEATSEKVEEVIDEQTPPADPATKGLDELLEWKTRRDKEIDDLTAWRTSLTAEREAEKAEHRKTLEDKEKEKSEHGVQKQEEARRGKAGETKRTTKRLRLFKPRKAS